MRGEAAPAATFRCRSSDPIPPSIALHRHAERLLPCPAVRLRAEIFDRFGRGNVVNKCVADRSDNGFRRIILDNMRGINQADFAVC